LHVRLLWKPCDIVFQSHLLVAHFLIRHPWLFYVVIRYEIPLNFLFLFLYCLKSKWAQPHRAYCRGEYCMLRLEGDVSGPEPLASQIVQKYLLDLCFSHIGA
jgi:hypothetical protein